MKSEDQIKSRLNSLYSKHKKLWVKENTSPSPDTCIHNYNHVPRPLVPRPRDLEFKLAPRVQKTLVVIENADRAVRICMYGSENQDKWNGTICDSVEHAQSCPLFTPSISIEEAQSQYENLIMDDEYVYENYKDIAALQWVLDIRAENKSVILTERPGFLAFVWSFLISWFTNVRTFGRKHDNRDSSGE